MGIANGNPFETGISIWEFLKYFKIKNPEWCPPLAVKSGFPKMGGSPIARWLINVYNGTMLETSK